MGQISRIWFVLPTLPIILGVLALVGWALDIGILKRGLASSVPMNPATAIGCILLGLEATRLQARNHASLISRAGQLAIWVVMVASVMKLSDLVLGTSFAIDTQLFSVKLDEGSGHPSRMAPNTAVCFFVSGWAMQFLRGRSNSSILTAQLLAAISTLFAVLAIVGYAYDVKTFYGMGIFVPMAFNTAVAFLFLSAAVLFTHPDKGFMRVFVNAGPAGAIASIFLPAAIFVPFLLGWISLVGQRAELYDTAFDHALSAVLDIVWLLSLTYIGVRGLYVSDKHRQLAEAELHRSESSMRAILDNSPFLVWLKDPEGRYITVNKALADFIGVKDLRQITGKTDLDFFPKELAEKYRADDAEVMRTRQPKHIEEEQALDGERLVWVETFKTPILDKNGNLLGTTGFAHDITERKQVEQKTRDLARRCQALMRTTLDGIHVMDEQGNTVEANDAFCRMLGYTHDEIVHMNVADFDAQWTAETLRTKFRESIGSSALIETVHRRKDGVLINVEISTSNVELDGRYYFFAASRNITERKHAEQELHIAATAFEAQEGIVVTDAQTRILRVNRAFTRLTGYSAEEAIGQTPAVLKSGRQDTEFYRAMWDTITRNNYWQGEMWNRRKNGEVYPEWLTVTAVTEAKGRVTNYIGTFSDITLHKQEEAEIRTLAFYDPLTSLPNRRLLRDRLQHTLAASTRHQNHGAILFIDLDNFKLLNDTKGHDLGDQLLIEVAIRLQACVREGDTVARLGGDEFVVMLEELSEDIQQAAAQTEAVGEKILVAISQPYSLQGYEQHSSTSIGISLFRDHEITVDELLKRADTALYEAKNAGRNTLRFYDPAMQAILEARATLEADLRDALVGRQFRLYFQMQAYHSGQIVGAEVLLRWQHPERGLVSPLQFIPLAEETGLILPIGQWVLDAACTQLKAWEGSARTRHLQLAVNVSARQFRQADFVEQVCAVLKKTAVEPGLLKLELTESVVLDNINDTIVKMLALKKIGVRFSMDDFGTGYSSLAYLTQLPIDQLKIDQSFVCNIGTKSSDAVIVQTIIGMAGNLGMEVIAEGVETEAQRIFLELNSCPLCQGYLFGRPVPLEEFMEKLENSPVH